MNNRPIALDLFSGCGGMSLGLEAAGFDIAAAVEIDPIHSLVHHYNFPYGVTICQDICNLSGEIILNKIKSKGFKDDIDLIAGGSPCQGFSYIGKRQLADPRNRLVFEYVRLVLEIKPKYFIFENVPGIITGKHQEFFHQLIQHLENNNYFTVKPPQILDASLFGAPQRRKRLILVGYRKDMKPLRYPLPTHGKNPDLLPFTTVAEAISDLSLIPVFIGKDEGIDVSQLDYKNFRQNLAISPQGIYTLCHKRAVNNFIWGHLGSKHTPRCRKRFHQTNPGKVEKVSHFFKLAPDGLSNTLRAGTARNRGAFTAPRPIHYQIPRCISIREAARLHTFPDWFQFHRTIWHGFREIGNAVIPLLAKSLGTEIIKALRASHDSEIDLSAIKVRKLKSVDDSILYYNMKQASLFWQVPNNVIPQRQRFSLSNKKLN
ncbi:MAG: DNA cytosine methyltransferase [Cyanobacteria bacterium J083]|nr:MAG: DNA cytosine methyltransferase [Cyanobacteria bacterium J083]